MMLCHDYLPWQPGAHCVLSLVTFFSQVFIDRLILDMDPQKKAQTFVAWWKSWLARREVICLNPVKATRKCNPIQLNRTWGRLFLLKPWSIIHPKTHSLLDYSPRASSWEGSRMYIWLVNWRRVFTFKVNSFKEQRSWKMNHTTATWTYLPRITKTKSWCHWELDGKINWLLLKETKKQNKTQNLVWKWERLRR